VTAAAAPAGSRLARLAARRGEPAPERRLERCDLCGAPIDARHRHLLDVERRELRCTCRACALLFDRPAAARGTLRLVGDRHAAIADLALDDAAWEDLRVPVDIVFFVDDAREGRVRAYYPSPMGATESLLALGAWADLVTANPILGSLEPDVEALLVNRVRGARGHWIVPIDECHALVGLIRMHWRGFTGGRAVWEQLAGFFAELDRRSRAASRHD